MNNTRTLPHDLESERAILGAALLDQEAIYAVMPIIGPDDFYYSAHRAVYTAMCQLASKSTPIDMMTVRAELDRTGKLDEAGGIAKVMGLTDGFPRGANIAHYARVVRDKAVLRSLIRTCHEGMTKAYDRDATPDLIAEIENELFNIAEKQFTSDAEPMSELLGRVYQDIERRAQTRGAITGIDTGLPSLNAMLGGFQKSDLVILAARPGMGKTTLAMNFASTAVECGYPTLVFSLEMSREQLATRVLCSVARVDSQRVRFGALTKDDWGRITTGAARCDGYPLYVDDSANQINELWAKARRIAIQRDIRLIVVDYIGLMTVERDRLKRSDNRVQEISIITRSLKKMAGELKVPVIALSQLNRAIESRASGKPQLSDLRESGSIEQDADVVMFLHSADKDEQQQGGEFTFVDLIVAKHRNGPVGSVSLKWFKQWTRFEELTTNQEAA